ncbi:MAG: hypothetical protein A4E58_00321 [Syntrophorhabdus sp. PtaB.Bin006]|nr:MAG: hypothetical protein A4E58_00321 [Syntrophorhabdus sp. PtaB.Bin006]
MSGDMKDFLDHELLEDKIPDTFDAVAGFQTILNQAGITLAGPEAGGGAAP